MPDVQQLLILSNTIKLEVEYFLPEIDTNRTCLLICHPHPQFGGDMYNNVVSSIFNNVINHNLGTFRFNFRGVGKSTGSHSNGQGELSDVKGCIDFLTNNLKINSILICGYSYGAAIGCSAVNYSKNVIGFIAISFPWDFMGLEYKLNTQTNKPKLFIQGNKDELAHYDRFLKHYEDYDIPKKFEIINGADHFYWGYEEQVANLVYRFYSSLLLNL